MAKAYDVELSVANLKDIENLYKRKYYNIFLSNYKIEGVSYQQENFILRKLWSDGKIAGFVPGYFDEPVFTTFAGYDEDIYDYPLHVSLYNNRGVAYIPSTPLLVDKEVVLGWAQKNEYPVRMTVDWYCKKIAQVEMRIKTNLNVQRTPYIFTMNTDDRAQVNEIKKNLNADVDNLMLNIDPKLISVLQTGAPYLIDKLYNYKQGLENELLTWMGINNIGSTEKKEHLINAEVNSNNELIQSHKDSFVDNLQDFCERMNKTFNLKNPMSASAKDLSYEYGGEDDMSISMPEEN